MQILPIVGKDVASCRFSFIIETLSVKPKVARIARINLRQTPFYSISVPASGLSNLRLAIPETAARGSDVAFNCSFNLQDDELYAVKWYRGTYEIFRRVKVKVSVGMGNCRHTDG